MTDLSKIRPTTPSFTLGYWRPWKEDSDIIDSYLDYIKDVQLVKYGADTVGKYIDQSSKENIRAINQLGTNLGKGLEVLKNEIEISNKYLQENVISLKTLVRQQNISIELLRGINNLLRVPDNEKERQRAIELGMQFFKNAEFNEELFVDALEELKKAESLMKQDYFVLHHIGLIYMSSIEHVDLKQAYRYFRDAAKYSEVESNKGAIQIYNVLDQQRNYTEDNLKLICAESFSCAASAAYASGKFEIAVIDQKKTVTYRGESFDIFILAKYQVRNGDVEDAIENLKKCISTDNHLASLVFKELDLISSPEVRNLIASLHLEIDEKNKNILNKINAYNSEITADITKDFFRKTETYESKMDGFKILSDWSNVISKKSKIIDEKSKEILKILENYNFQGDFEKLKLLIREIKLNDKSSVEEKERLLIDSVNYCIDNNIDIDQSYRDELLKEIKTNNVSGLEQEKNEINKKIDNNIVSTIKVKNISRKLNTGGGFGCLSFIFLFIIVTISGVTFPNLSAGESGSFIFCLGFTITLIFQMIINQLIVITKEKKLFDGEKLTFFDVLKQFPWFKWGDYNFNKKWKRKNQTEINSYNEKLKNEIKRIEKLQLLEVEHRLIELNKINTNDDKIKQDFLDVIKTQNNKLAHITKEVEDFKTNRNILKTKNTSDIKTNEPHKNASIEEWIAYYEDNPDLIDDASNITDSYKKIISEYNQNDNTINQERSKPFNQKELEELEKQNYFNKKENTKEVEQSAKKLSIYDEFYKNVNINSVEEMIEYENKNAPNKLYEDEFLLKSKLDDDGTYHRIHKLLNTIICDDEIFFLSNENSISVKKFNKIQPGKLGKLYKIRIEFSYFKNKNLKIRYTYLDQYENLITTFDIPTQ